MDGKADNEIAVIYMVASHFRKMFGTMPCTSYPTDLLHDANFIRYSLKDIGVFRLVISEQSSLISTEDPDFILDRVPPGNKVAYYRITRFPDGFTWEHCPNGFK